MPSQVESQVLFDADSFGNQFQLPVYFLVGGVGEHLLTLVGRWMVFIFLKDRQCRRKERNIYPNFGVYRTAVHLFVHLKFEQLCNKLIWKFVKKRINSGVYAPLVKILTLLVGQTRFELATPTSRT